MKDLTNTSIFANIVSGMDASAGKIEFHSDNFSFSGKRMNGSIKRGKIAYADIAKVKKKNTMLVFPNGLIVELKDKTEYIFILDNRNEMREYLLSKIQK